jgi:hypothetical protein
MGIPKVPEWKKIGAAVKSGATNQEQAIPLITTRPILPQMTAFASVGD